MQISGGASALEGVEGVVGGADSKVPRVAQGFGMIIYFRVDGDSVEVGGGELDDLGRGHGGLDNDVEMVPSVGPEKGVTFGIEPHIVAQG